MNAARWVVAGVAATAMAAGFAADPRLPLEPVMVGGNDDLDACMSQGLVKAKNFVFLKSKPSADAPNLDKLLPGEMVNVCSESDDGKWLGVVLSPRGEPTDCGVSSSIEKRTPYKGPCRSGWLLSRQVEVVAG